MATHGLICPDWPYHVVVEWAFFIAVKTDNQFDMATFSTGTGQPGVTPPRDTSLFLLGKRSSSGCLCLSCARTFSSNALWWEEGGGLLLCCLFTARSVLLLAFLSAYCCFSTRYSENIRTKSTWFDFGWGKQTASHLTPPSASWSLSLCSHLQFFLQTCSEITAISAFLAPFQLAVTLLLLSCLICFSLWFSSLNKLQLECPVWWTVNWYIAARTSKRKEEFNYSDPCPYPTVVSDEMAVDLIGNKAALPLVSHSFFIACNKWGFLSCVRSSLVQTFPLCWCNGWGGFTAVGQGAPWWSWWRKIPPLSGEIRRNSAIRDRK